MARATIRPLVVKNERPFSASSQVGASVKISKIPDEPSVLKPNKFPAKSISLMALFGFVLYKIRKKH